MTLHFQGKSNVNNHAHVIGDSDGCSPKCEFDPVCSSTGCAARCGDGIIEPGEACDDGDVISGDGCSSTCQVETGYSCSGAPSTCTVVCGNGIITAPETCDDGGTTSGNGICSSWAVTRCVVCDGGSYLFCSGK